MPSSAFLPQVPQSAIYVPNSVTNFGARAHVSVPVDAKKADTALTRSSTSRIYLSPIDEVFETTNNFGDDLVSEMDVVSSGIEIQKLPGVEEIQTFEPIVNYPALGACLGIAIVFSLLQLRISGVGEAVDRRKEALKSLRQIKASQLSSADLGSKRPTDNAVISAVQKYEKALEEEEQLRTIIPGVRLAAPNAPARSDDDVSAAKQFLGRDLVGESNGENEKDLFLDQERKELLESKGMDVDNPRKGFSNGALAVLALVVLSQIALLCILSIDPMATGGFY